MKVTTGHPPELIAEVVNLCRAQGNKRDDGAVMDAVNRRFGTSLTKQAIAGIFKRHKSKKIAEPPDESPAFNQYDNAVVRLFYDDKRQVKDMNWRDQIHGFRAAQEFRDDHDIHQHTAKVRVETKTPIAICDLSDLHIGSPYTDYVTLERDIAALKTDPRFYLLKGGDWVDKFMPGFKTALGPMKQLHPALIQMLTAENILKEFDGRVVAAIDGNHEEMDARYTGIETEYFIHRGKPYPYLKHGGLIHLTVGETTYKILWKHNYGHGSALNPVNAHRWLRMLAEGVDIAILEHIHNPMTLDSQVGGFLDELKQRVDIRTGSYKIDDDYSVKRFKPGVIGPGVAVLYPEKRKIVAYNGPDAISDAQVYMNGLNSGTNGPKRGTNGKAA